MKKWLERVLFVVTPLFRPDEKKMCKLMAILCPPSWFREGWLARKVEKVLVALLLLGYFSKCDYVLDR